MATLLNKLTLNQETLSNLTSDKSQHIAGSGFHSNCTCPTTTAPLSCIECNPPK